VIGAAALAQAQAPDAIKSSDDRLSTALTKLCRDDTAAYTLTFTDNDTATFTLKEVMKWTNPVRNGQNGVVSVWLKDGRAQALSTVFANPQSKGRITILHEFQSLATRPIIAQKGNQVQWKPTQPGVHFQPIPEAPEPAESPVARLRQMRSLVRDFTAHSVSIQTEETRWELRMLPAPLYRYESSGPETLDGALFTFVSTAGTDPELLLLIEARKNSSDGWSWQYAPARFSDHSLHLMLRDQEVWTFINQERNYRFAAGPVDIYRLFDDRTEDASKLLEAAK